MAVLVKERTQEPISGLANAYVIKNLHRVYTIILSPGSAAASVTLTWTTPTSGNRQIKLTAAANGNSAVYQPTIPLNIGGKDVTITLSGTGASLQLGLFGYDYIVGPYKNLIARFTGLRYSQKSLVTRLTGLRVSQKSMSSRFTCRVVTSKNVVGRFIGLVVGTKNLVARVTGLLYGTKSLVTRVTCLKEDNKGLVARFTGLVVGTKGLVCRLTPTNIPASKNLVCQFTKA